MAPVPSRRLTQLGRWFSASTDRLMAQHWDAWPAPAVAQLGGTVPMGHIPSLCPCPFAVSLSQPQHEGEELRVLAGSALCWVAQALRLHPLASVSVV